MNYMNNVEKFLFEQMETSNFHKIISEDFSFIDSLIDRRDLEKNNSYTEEY